jgi:hypothetical protein
MNRKLILVNSVLIGLLLSVGVGLASAQGLVAQGLYVDRDIINPQESATVTVPLTNPDNLYGATLYQGFATPISNVAGSSSITGGGAVYLSAGETKTVTLQIENSGNLPKDTLATFTYSVTNENGDVLYSKDVPLLLKQGLGLPTESSSQTLEPQQETQNNATFTLAMVALIVIVLSIVGFAVFFGLKKNNR